MNFANFIPAILGILGLTAFQEKDGKRASRMRNAQP